ncbi:MAG TPA: hypothetical protein VFE51_19965 [Verrucomicrobiae bacterium]|nr:hypothetical protein [Verrucomicrobiae bacterium]
MKSRFIRNTTALVLGGAILASPAMIFAADSDAETKTVTGEIVDLMCYLDHGAKGEKHKGCAEKCIKSGGPVGLVSGDDVYLVIGDHKPMNDELASLAAQKVTLKGKVVEKHGMKMIENAEIQK